MTVGASVSGMLALDSKAISTDALFSALVVTKATKRVKLAQLVAGTDWTIQGNTLK